MDYSLTPYSFNVCFAFFIKKNICLAWSYSDSHLLITSLASCTDILSFFISSCSSILCSSSGIDCLISLILMSLFIICRDNSCIFCLSSSLSFLNISIASSLIFLSCSSVIIDYTLFLLMYLLFFLHHYILYSQVVVLLAVMHLVILGLCYSIFFLSYSNRL